MLFLELCGFWLLHRLLQWQHQLVRRIASPRRAIFLPSASSAFAFDFYPLYESIYNLIGGARERGALNSRHLQAMLDFLACLIRRLAPLGLQEDGRAW